MPGAEAAGYSAKGVTSVDAKPVDVNTVDELTVDAKPVLSDPTVAMAPYTEEKSLRMRFAERLRHFRILQGISQEALAARAGFHRTYVSQIERGATNVSVDNIEKLAKALEVDPQELFKPTGS